MGQGEEKYHLLFQNMAEGFALYELLYDEAGQPVDWRILETNDAYTHHTGIAREGIVGRRMSEIYPELIPEYLPRFAQVVATQRPAEFETYSKPAGRSGAGTRDRVARLWRGRVRLRGPGCSLVQGLNNEEIAARLSVCQPAHG